MIDARHRRFAQLMDEVETLEDRLASLEKGGADCESRLALQEKLAEARNHLAQLSDGCGTGHNPAGQ